MLKNRSRRRIGYGLGAVALAVVAALGVSAMDSSGHDQNIATMQPGPLPLPVGGVGAPDTMAPMARNVAAVGPAIIGGHPASAAPSWIVQVMWNYDGDPNMPQCTGELIANNVVRTNAHCVTDANGDALDPAKYKFHVLVGSLCTPDTGSSLDPGTAPVNGCAAAHENPSGVDLPVRRIASVPGWDWGVRDSAGRIDDEALLFLNGYVTNTPVEVARRDARVGTAVTQYGYGRTNPSDEGPEPGVLYELTGNKIAPSGPCDTNPDLPLAVGEVCVTGDNFTGVCGGDSGGPLLERVDGRMVLAGGTSRSPGMQPGCGLEADVYTSTAYFRPWETAVMAGVDPVTALRYLPGSQGTHGTDHQGPVSASMAAVQHQWQSEYHLAG